MGRLVGLKLQVGKLWALLGGVERAQLRFIVPEYDPAPVIEAVAVTLVPGEMSDTLLSVIAIWVTVTFVLPVEML
jgi:hypothetical protein